MRATTRTTTRTSTPTARNPPSIRPCLRRQAKRHCHLSARASAKRRQSERKRRNERNGKTIAINWMMAAEVLLSSNLRHPRGKRLSTVTPRSTIQASRVQWEWLPRKMTRYHSLLTFPLQRSPTTTVNRPKRRMLILRVSCTSCKSCSLKISMQALRTPQIVSSQRLIHCPSTTHIIAMAPSFRICSTWAFRTSTIKRKIATPSGHQQNLLPRRIPTTRSC